MGAEVPRVLLWVVLVTVTVWSPAVRREAESCTKPLLLAANVVSGGRTAAGSLEVVRMVPV